MNIDKKGKLNELLKHWRPGVLFFSSWLNKHGYSDQLMQQYRKSGWFSSLSKAVMHRTGDKLSTFGAISSYNSQMNKEFYVGAHSALELFGYNHYIPMGKPVIMIGHPRKDEVPDWMKKCNFEYELKFFSTKLLPDNELTFIRRDDFNILVSEPEQAFLECLLLAPNQYAYIDLFYIMEQLTALRAEVVQKMLEQTNNIRIKRLFLYMAKKADHYWFKDLNVSKIDIGSGKQKLADNGVYLSEYRITIPKELYEYD